MQLLEKDLRDAELKKVADEGRRFHHDEVKHVSEMSTEELIKELEKDTLKRKKEQPAEKAKLQQDADLKQLLLLTEKQNKKRDEKPVSKKEKANKSSQSSGLVKKEDTEKLKQKQNSKKGVDEALLKRAIKVIEELTHAEQHDTEVKGKSVKLLKDLMLADKQALEKKNADKIKVQKKETEEFKKALNEDSDTMKKLADQYHNGGKPSKKEKKKEDKTASVDLKELNDIAVHVQDKDQSYLQLMADDLMKKISDEISQDQDKTVKREEADGMVCQDTRRDCPDLKKYCKTHKAKLIISCPLTCKYCLPPPPCADKWTGEKAHYCKVLKMADRCHENRVDKYCSKTCGYCMVPTSPKCSKTQYGCCWDKETVKMDKEGKNCKPCKNDYFYVCKRFKVECGEANRAGEFMRKHCPETCNMCSGKCEDDPVKKFYCPFWKKDLNWCTERPEIMRQTCPVTCGLC